MQPEGRLRRNWNWPRLFKKARAGLAAVLTVLPILGFVGLVYLAIFFRRLFGRPTSGRSLAARSPSDDHNPGDPDSTRPQQPPRTAPASLRASLPPGTYLMEESLSDRLPASRSKKFDEEADQRSFASGLALCATPAAVHAIAEEVAMRGELNSRFLEDAMGRLIDLGASTSDARMFLRIAGYEWLYEMAIPPSRVIRLTRLQTTNGSPRWQHYAVHRICYETDREEGAPHAISGMAGGHAQTRLFVYFDREGRMVAWDRPRGSPGRLS